MVSEYVPKFEEKADVTFVSLEDEIRLFSTYQMLKKRIFIGGGKSFHWPK